MSNELSLTGLKNHLVTYRQSMTQSVNIGGFMKFGKDGVWSYGQDGTVVDPEGVWLINPYTLGYGFIAWHNGKPENEVYVPLNRPISSRSALPDVVAKDGWQEQRGFELVCIAGKDKGEQVTYKTNSKGGLQALAAITDAIAEAADGPDPTLVFPKVRLGSTSYKHNDYGKIYKPVLEVLGWSKNAPEPEPAEGAPARPKPRPAAAVAEPEPEPEETVAAPRAVNGRRRRSSIEA